MYDLLDRPVAELPATDRLLLDATRGWVHALTLGGEPIRVVSGRFTDRGVAFNAGMRVFDRAAIGTLALQRPCHETVEEAEAVVLGMWRLVMADRLPDALATARLLVSPAAAGELVAAMQRVPVSASLAEQGSVRR